jgi:membrane fusion protein (multidrug efflux system)
VQRVPVRVELDAKQVAAHPLRVGLSMEAKVDVAEQSGQPLTAASAAHASSSTHAFDPQQAAADRMVHDIIAANLCHGSPRLAANAAPQRVAMKL